MVSYSYDVAEVVPMFGMPSGVSTELGSQNESMSRVHGAAAAARCVRALADWAAAHQGNGDGDDALVIDGGGDAVVRKVGVTWRRVVPVPLLGDLLEWDLIPRAGANEARW